MRTCLDEATQASLPRVRERSLRAAAAWREMYERARTRSEEHTSELQSLMRISYAVFCLKKKKTGHTPHNKVKFINTRIKLTSRYAVLTIRQSIIYNSNT